MSALLLLLRSGLAMQGAAPHPQLQALCPAVPHLPCLTGFGFLIVAGRGWGNNESQTYTSSEANVRVNNGTLIITALRWRAWGRAEGQEGGRAIGREGRSLGGRPCVHICTHACAEKGESPPAHAPSAMLKPPVRVVLLWSMHPAAGPQDLQGRVHQRPREQPEQRGLLPGHGGGRGQLLHHTHRAAHEAALPG